MEDLKSLLAEKQALEQKIEEVRRAEKARVLGEIRSMMAEYGITAAEVLAGAGRPGRSKTVGEPKYRDPATGKTWTGKGKPPLWIVGKDRAQYLIHG